MRIDKYISLKGYATRSEAKKLLRKKKVLVNDEIIVDCKHKISIGDEITFNELTSTYQEFFYYLLNKPKDYVCANSDDYHEVVFDLLYEEDFQTDLFTVGRLDIDTTGILIITNDGKLAHQLLSPNRHVPKTYLVTCKDIVDNHQISQLKVGVVISHDYLTKPAKVNQVSDHVIELTISEGKFHQVKEMLQSVSNEVVELERIKFNNLELPSDLPLGEYRQITKEDLL